MRERIWLRNGIGLGGSADFFTVWKNKVVVDSCKKSTEVRKTFKSLAFEQ